jgi:hypothetical protein
MHKPACRFALWRFNSSSLTTGLVGWLSLASPRLGWAEGSVSYKYSDYREAAGRVAVQTQNALIEQDLGTEMHFKLQGVVDAIAGATPNGQPAPAGSDQVVLAQLYERRKAWNADFSRQFPRCNLALGVANSRESDYTSTAWSVNTLTDFNQKNTTLLAGVAGTNDDVKVYYQPTWAGKRSSSFIVGINQLLDPRTSVTFNLTGERATGFLADQYKVVQKDSEVAPGLFLPFTYGENRPAERTKWIALALLNRAYPDLHGALEASYRLYHDSFGTTAHTVELTWLQRMGDHFILQPGFRFYDQSAADFYHYNLNQTSIVPTYGPPRTQGPFYSSDYRLSALRTITYGMKAIWTPTPRLQLDLDVAQYDMRGKDGVTPRSAYMRATIVTGGLKITW